MGTKKKKPKVKRAVKKPVKKKPAKKKAKKKAKPVATAFEAPSEEATQAEPIDAAQALENRVEAEQADFSAMDTGVASTEAEDIDQQF